MADVIDVTPIDENPVEVVVDEKIVEITKEDFKIEDGKTIEQAVFDKYETIYGTKLDERYITDIKVDILSQKLEITFDAAKIIEEKPIEEPKIILDKDGHAVDTITGDVWDFKVDEEGNEIFSTLRKLGKIELAINAVKNFFYS
jgi:hypothetical protein